MRCGCPQWLMIARHAPSCVCVVRLGSLDVPRDSRPRDHRNRDCGWIGRQERQGWRSRGNRRTVRIVLEQEQGLRGVRIGQPESLLQVAHLDLQQPSVKQEAAENTRHAALRPLGSSYSLRLLCPVCSPRVPRRPGVPGRLRRPCSLQRELRLQDSRVHLVYRGRALDVRGCHGVCAAPTIHDEAQHEGRCGRNWRSVGSKGGAVR